MHRFCNQCPPFRYLHTTKTKETQVQSMEDGCFNAVRLFHHAAYYFEHTSSDDEGIFEKYIFNPARVGFAHEYKAHFGTLIIQLFSPTFQYHGQHATYDKVLLDINILFTGLFTIEAILKIFGFGIKVFAR